MFDFDNTLICPRLSDVSSRKQVELMRTFNKQNGDIFRCVPIIAANMVNIGTPEVSKHLWENHQCLTAIQKDIHVDDNVAENAFETISMGVDPSSIKSKPFFSLDVANGYTTDFGDYVEAFVEVHPDSFIMAGNVATYEGADQLFRAGADAVKVGLGSGAACTTRMKTGVGFPQLEAVMECRGAADPYNGYICSDGGHRTPGDVAKSFAAGADFVMLGTMLAGTNETGDFIYGNASRQAQGELARYRAEEGTHLLVPHKGSLDDVMLDLLGGLRSACTYVGAWDIEEFQGKAELMKVG